MVWDHFRSVLGRRGPGVAFLSRDADCVFRAVSPVELVGIGRTHERTCLSTPLCHGTAPALPSGTLRYYRVPVPHFPDPAFDGDRLAPLLFGVCAAMERSAVR